MSWVLVTGASSGLGLEFCNQLAGRGHNVVMVARRENVLVTEAQRIENYYGVTCEVLPADLATQPGLKAVARRLAANERPISLLVNNAGFALAEDFVDGSASQQVRGLNVMVRAVMLLSQTAASRMRRRGRGAILNVSSVASGTAMGTYAAHKTWVEIFSCALAEELRGSGVQVMALKPGTTDTGFFSKITTKIEDVPTIARLTPEYVVEQALNDLARGKVISVPSVIYKVMDFLTWKAPRSLVCRFTGYLQRDRFRV